MNNNFYYCGVDVDYDRNSDWCECEDYCRCSTLDNVTIKNVDISDVFEQFNREYNPLNDKITSYCIDVILRKNLAYSSDWYEVNVCWGYYGQEIDDVTMNNFNKVVEDISALISIPENIDKVRFALIYDYGRLLPKVISAKSAIVKKITISDINQNDWYGPKIDDDFKPIEKVPMWILSTNDDKTYKIIDWYHRFEYLLLNERKNASYIIIT